MDDSIYSKSNPLRLANIWTNNINNAISDPCRTIFITNIINVEHYDLRFDLLFNHIMDHSKNHNF
jgi:hypothetical protein